MRKIFAKITSFLCDDKGLLYLTIALIILGGLVRIFDFTISRWCLSAAFIPYFIMRSVFYFKHRNRSWTTIEKQRSFVLIMLFVAVVFNFVTLSLDIFPRFRAEFLMLFLILVDYLFVTNSNYSEEKEEQQ